MDSEGGRIFRRQYTKINTENSLEFYVTVPYKDDAPSTIRCSEQSRNLFAGYLKGLPIVSATPDWEKRPLRFCNVKLARLERKMNRILCSLSREEKLKRAKKVNPFENVKKTFSTRNATKLANLDKIFNYKITDSTNRVESVYPSHGCNPLYYVADIGCGQGTGSYTEYIVRRRQFFNCKSFGLSTDYSYLSAPGTFRSSWPFFLDMFHREGEMDITDEDVRLEFVKFVRKGTEKELVNLCLADAVGWHPSQPYHEFFFMKKFVAELLTSLKVLRNGGTLVATCFEMNTVMSAGLFYLLYYCFHTVSINKPKTSRPSSPERFLVCFGYFSLKGEIVIQYMEKILRVWNRNSDIEVVECVPVAVFESDIRFKKYLLAVNENLLKQQIEFMEHMICKRKFAEPPGFTIKLSNYLNFPVNAVYKKYMSYQNPEQFYSLILNRSVKSSNQKRRPCGVYVITSTRHPSILCSTLKGTFINERGQWILMEDLCIPPFTILLVTYTHMLVKKDRLPCLRILDCAILHGLEVNNHCMYERLGSCEKFVKAITPTSGSFHFNVAKRTFITPTAICSARIYLNLHSIRRSYYRRFEGRDYIWENNQSILCDTVADLEDNDTFWETYESFMKRYVRILDVLDLEEKGALPHSTIARGHPIRKM